MEFYVEKKVIECDVKEIVGDNDYEATFALDDEWDGKAVQVKVVWNNKVSEDFDIVDDKCTIPAYMFKKGNVSIGVFADGLASSRVNITVRESIKQDTYAIAVPHKETWEKIQEKVADVVTNSEFDSKVNNYLVEQAIPDKIAKAQSDITTVARNSAGAIVVPASGYVVSLADASEKAFKSISLHGKSTQDGTPSVDTHIEIKSVGDDGNVGVNVYGKNLIDYINASWTVNVNNGSYSISDNVITITTNESTTSGIFAKCSHLQYFPQIALSFEAYADTDGAILSAGFGGRQSFTLSTSWEKFSGVFTPVVSGTNAIQFYGADTFGCTIYIRNVQVENGDNVTPYEPYVGTHTAIIDLPEPLRGLPVSSGGNYTDADGQAWWADNLEIFADGTGQITREIGHVVLDGTETWYPNVDWNTNYPDYYHAYVRCGKRKITTTDGNKTFCNMFPCYNEYFANTPTDAELCFASPSDGAIYLFIHKDNLASYDVAGLQAYTKALYDAGTPITFTFLADTPVITELTTEQVQAFVDLNSYKPNTVVTMDDMGDVVIEYVADTKKYIDNSVIGTSDKLKGKKVLVFGDSIMAGDGWAGGYANLIKENHPNAEVINLAVSGATLIQNDTGNYIYTQFKNYYNFDAEVHGEEPDLIVFDGGGNDCMYRATIGAASDSCYPNGYLTTMCDALEYMIYAIKTVYPNTKMLYVSTPFAMDWKSETIPSVPSNAIQMEYLTAREAVLEKWGIPEADIRREGNLTSCIEGQITNYFIDSLHLNEAGYRYTHPIIEAMIDKIF